MCIIVFMSLTERIYGLHTFGGISAAQIIGQSIGCVIVTDSDHGIETGIYRVFSVGACELVIILVYSTHDKQFDQTGRLHGLIIDTAFGFFKEITDINGPTAISCGKLSLKLI